MKMMRDFITDERLGRALDEVESWWGYKFKASPMPLSHRHRSRCTMHMHPLTNECELLFIEDEPQSQATYCHELNHVVMWMLGAPLTCETSPIEFQILLKQHEPVKLSWNLIQHLPLWELTREMGFDEIDDNLPLIEDMFHKISQDQVYRDAPIEIRVSLQAMFLAFGLVSPSTLVMRDKICTAATKTMPKSLELAENILLNLAKLPLLSESGCQAALSQLFGIIKPPIERLRLVLPDRVCPTFRSRILKAVDS